jgi:hypothetical protein
MLLRFKPYLFTKHQRLFGIDFKTGESCLIQSEAFRFRQIDRGVRKGGPENRKLARILLDLLSGTGLDKFESAIGQRRIFLDQGGIRKEFVFGVVSVAMTG